MNKNYNIATLVLFGLFFILLFFVCDIFGLRYFLSHPYRILPFYLASILAVSFLSGIITRKRVSSKEIVLFQLISLVLLFYLMRFFISATYSQIPAFLMLGVFLTIGSVILSAYLLNSFQSVFMRIEPKFKIPFYNQAYDSVTLILTYALVCFIFGIAGQFEVLNYFILILAIFVGIHIYSISKSKELEIELTGDKEPKLFKFLEELTKEFGIKMPESVVMVPDSTIAVTGIIRKKLILGVIPLRQLKEDELKAIIAHEFGHFYGKDTFFGGLVYLFSRSLDSMGKTIRLFSRIHIIAFFIGMALLIMNAIFSFISLFYLRQREYFADIYAAQIVGANIFNTALKKYVGYNTFFEYVSTNLIIRVYQEKRVFFKNIYQIIGSKVRDKAYEAIAAKAIEKRSGIFGTHPPLKKRLALVSMFANKKASKESSIRLFKNLESYEKSFSPLYSLIVLKGTGMMTYSDIEEITKGKK
jgi:Zn-dependent protease with chaperone function